MLHISDVEKRLKVNPEPKEVTEMRENIINAFSNLEFFEGPHEYILHGKDGKDTKLPSVSSIVQKFEPHVDWDTIRLNKAKREGIDPDVLKRQWRENNLKSTSRGSQTHLFGESCMYFCQGHPEVIENEVAHYQMEDDFLVPYCGKEEAVTHFWEDMLAKDNVWPVMPEAKIYTGYNDKLGLKNQYCGTFDLLFAARGKDGVIRPFIADYKSNGSLTNDYNRAYGKMMLPPFDYLVDEPLSHYTLQLSLYAMGLEQLGYEMTHRIIIWLKDDGTYEKIPVKDVRKELKAVLQYKQGR